jgi:rubrerythrin
MTTGEDMLYYRLFEEAERVRWSLHGLPFDAIQHARVDQELISAVRAAVAAELETHGATRQLMDMFADDGDFSQWLAVWLYEETKHPHALILWLQHVGIAVASDAIAVGHSAQKFSNSRAATLASNVIAEVIASQAYLALARYSPEPVLAHIATRLAGDEARHGSHFYSYLRKELARSQQRDRDESKVLIVLDMWLRDSANILHPVRTTLAKSGSEFPHPNDGRGEEGPSTEIRLCKMFGYLIGQPDVTSRTDVRRALRERAPSASRTATRNLA